MAKKFDINEIKRLFMTGEIDLGSSGKGLFAVYPYCKDGNYRQILKSRGEINVEDVVGQVRQILSGLDVLNTRIIHRDLKPENILVDNGILMLADYGLSKFVDDATRTFSFKGAGTPAYMAPEVWQFRKITRATDLYAFGIMFFEGLTGRLPFQYKDIQDLEQLHLYSPAPRTKSFNPKVPDLIDGLVKKLLAKDHRGFDY